MAPEPLQNSPVRYYLAADRPRRVRPDRPTAYPTVARAAGPKIILPSA